MSKYYREREEGEVRGPDDINATFNQRHLGQDDVRLQTVGHYLHPVPESELGDRLSAQAIADHENLLQCRALLGLSDERDDNVYSAIQRLQKQLAECDPWHPMSEAPTDADFAANPGK